GAAQGSSLRAGRREAGLPSGSAVRRRFSSSRLHGTPFGAMANIRSMPAMRAIRQMRARERPRLGAVITRDDFSEPLQDSHRGTTMRTPFTRKQIGLAAACALALGVLAGTAVAQVQPDEKALVTDTRGIHVTSGSGLCVRSAFGPPPAWTEGCHAAVPVARYVAPAPTPTAAAPVVLAAAALPVYEKV